MLDIIMVPEERFELSRLSPYASETYAYTNSATPANLLRKFMEVCRGVGNIFNSQINIEEKYRSATQQWNTFLNYGRFSIAIGNNAVNKNTQLL